MKIGVAKNSIQPTGETPLGGFGYFIADRIGVPRDNDLLAVTAVSFTDQYDKKAVLCSADVIAVNEASVTEIKQRVQKELGDVHVLYHATHTHSGPITLDVIGGASGINNRYLSEILVPNSVDAIIASFDNPSPANISYNETSLPELSANRLDRGPIDTRLRLVRLAGAFGTQLALAHYPCHPSMLRRDSRLISRDYPGAVIDYFASNGDPNSPMVQFLSGPAGEINPRRVIETRGNTSLTDVRQMGEKIGHAASELLVTAGTDTGNANDLVTYEGVIEIPLDGNFDLNPDLEIDHYREGRGVTGQRTLDELHLFYRAAAEAVNTSQDHYLKVPISVIGLGNIAFVGVGCEIFSRTAREIEAMFPDKHVMILPTSNGYQSYIPPKLCFHKGSYPARRAHFSFGRKPPTSDCESIFIDQTVKAIQRVCF